MAVRGATAQPVTAANARTWVTRTDPPVLENGCSVLHPSPVRFGTKAKLAAQILFRKRR
jgi:hypothetical protein